MKFSQQAILLSSLILFLSCTVKPTPINYGNDACVFCSMNIVDARHTAQLVTTKGKNFKFDAIECMIHYLQENPDRSMEFTLVADYANPGQMMDVTQATFLIHPEIPSPMGASLSAFANQTSLDATVSMSDGEVYNWKHIRTKIAQKK